ncbi:MAG: hypothetical protein ACREX0_09200, partial [Noviherbaspirillum sp.]
MPDPSFVIPLLWQSAVLPFGVALALLFALRRTSGPLAAFALAAGFVASYFAVFHAQWSPLPKTALDWLLWLALAGTAGAVLAERLPRAAARMIVRLLLSLASAALVVWPALPSLGLQAAGMLAISAGVLICVAWSGLAWTAQSQSRPTPAPLLMVIAGGAGLVLMLDASAALGQLSGALAAALAASALFQL